MQGASPKEFALRLPNLERVLGLGDLRCHDGTYNLELLPWESEGGYDSFQPMSRFR